jgi:hypothetical protein
MKNGKIVIIHIRLLGKHTPTNDRNNTFQSVTNILSTLGPEANDLTKLITAPLLDDFYVSCKLIYSYKKIAPHRFFFIHRLIFKNLLQIMLVTNFAQGMVVETVSCFLMWLVELI